MMPQMDAGEPMSGRADAPYGRYEGDQHYSQQQYEVPPYGQSQLGSSATMGKLHISPGSSKANAGQRLSLAIVSVVVLIPITAIVLGITDGGLSGLIGLAMVAGAIVLINAVFNESFK